MHRVTFLKIEFLGDCSVAFSINNSGQGSPILSRGTNPVHAALVMQREFVPKADEALMAISDCVISKGIIRKRIKRAL